jgi:hypothetical protein
VDVFVVLPILVVRVVEKYVRLVHGVCRPVLQC